MSKVYWTTNNGVVMDVDTMSDTHVRNAFKMLLRTIQKLKEEKAEKAQKNSKHNFTLSGDMAQEFNNSNLEDDDDSRLEEIWEDVSFLNH